MTPGTLLLLALAGGVGAALRYLVDAMIRARTGDHFPWPTALINLSGSLLLGILTGLTVARVDSGELSAVLGTGFLGGYTTFSTASYETVTLLRERRYTAAIAYGLGILLGCVGLALAGYAWGSRM